jgi:hypothetical protein
LRPRNRAWSPRPQPDRLDVADADELLDRPLRNALELAGLVQVLEKIKQIAGEQHIDPRHSNMNIGVRIPRPGCPAVFYNHRFTKFPNGAGHPPDQDIVGLQGDVIVPPRNICELAKRHLA